jgi:Rps23 Pro-64 3,4-dihydroxylase Tpa1-like proline 4-hydroxylase
MPLDFTRWDSVALAEAWRSAKPFPHIILDDVLPADELATLREVVTKTPHYLNVSEIYEMMGSKDTLTAPAILDFHRALDEPGRFWARAVSGKQSIRVSLRSYVYLQGSYLLPHNDRGVGIFDRVLAWTFYLLPRESSVGGELELFECELDGEDIIATKPSTVIEPLANRLCLFDVSPRSLHQVREVTLGGRLSLSGWFHG